MSDSAANPTALVGHCLLDLQSGDPAARAKAIDRLLAITENRLRILTRRMLGAYQRVRRYEETDDVLQNAAMRLCQALTAAPPATTTEFFRLAALQLRRELIDLARHYYGPLGAGRHEASPLPIFEAASADSRDDIGLVAIERTHDPGRLAAWAEFHRHVDALPDDLRTLFDLLWYQGHSQPEAAELLGIPIRTLKRRWQSARRSLYDALGGELPV